MSSGPGPGGGSAERGATCAACPATQATSRRRRSVRRGTAAGGTFRPGFPPGIELDVSELFDSGWEAPAVRVVGKKPADDDPAFCVPDEPLDLEDLLLAGHPLRRYEVLDDVASCVVGYRDPAKARRDFEHCARQAARLAGLPAPGRPGDTFEAAPFRLRHDGHRVHLDVHYHGVLQRELLEIFSLKGVWDTGG